MLRKIKTRREAEKKAKSKQIIVGVVLVGLLVLSTVGYSFLSQDDESEEDNKEYNSFEFVRVGGGWNLKETNFYFQFLPQEVENVSIAGFFDLNVYSGKPLYIVNDNSASQEILINLGPQVLRYQEACLDSNGTECKNEELPKKTCEDNLIIFELDEESEGDVWQEENCVYISGDLVKASDAFLYKLLGVR